MTKLSKDYGVFNYVTIAIAILASVILSLTKLSSPQAAFSVINQYQLLLLLPLLRTYIPDQILLFIEGFDFMMFGTILPYLIKIESIDEWTNKFTEKIDDAYVSNIGVKYKSAIINCLHLIIMIILTITLNILLYFLKQYYQHINKVNWISRTMGRFNRILTFGYYIVLINQVYMLIVLSAAIELNNHNVYGRNRIISMII